MLIAASQELPPWAVAQGRRSDEEHTLAALDGRLPDELAGDEGLTETDAVGDEHPGAPQIRLARQTPSCWNVVRRIPVLPPPSSSISAP